MLHPNAIKSQLRIVEEKLEDMEFRYNRGSIAMQRYLYPQILKLRKQRDKWLAKGGI